MKKRWGQYLCHFTRTLPREMLYREERRALRAFSGVHSVWPPEMRPMHAPHAWPPFWIFSFSRWRYGGGNWRILWPTCWARGDPENLFSLCYSGHVMCIIGCWHGANIKQCIVGKCRLFDYLAVGFCPERVFLNFYEAQESIPRNQFRQPM